MLGNAAPGKSIFRCIGPHQSHLGQPVRHQADVAPPGQKKFYCAYQQVYAHLNNKGFNSILRKSSKCIFIKVYIFPVATTV